jgi:hypothetical protein
MLEKDSLLFKQAGETVARPGYTGGAAPSSRIMQGRVPQIINPSVNALPNLTKNGSALPLVMSRPQPPAIAPGATINGEYTPTQAEIDASNGMHIGHMPIEPEVTGVIQHLKKGFHSYVSGLGDHTADFLQEQNRPTQRPNDVTRMTPLPLVGGAN